MRKLRYSTTVHAQPRPLPEHGWRNQLMLARRKSREQAIGALGLLGRARDHAADEEELRIVAAVEIGVDGFHVEILR